MLDNDGQLLIAKSGRTPLFLLPSMIARHGLVTGATGTGKTISLQVMAESLSAFGVPVFVTDVKGDLAGIARAGAGERIEARVEKLGLAEAGFKFQGSPACFWDVFGQDGHPMRTTPSELGPLLLARLLDLNDTQTGVLQVLFRIADENGLLLLDLKDLRKLVEYVANNRADYAAAHGHLAPTSLGAIQRSLLSLEDQGGAAFFGEPALDFHDLIRREGGRGVVNVLAADKLMRSPRLYACLLLWLLSALYEGLPEVGDVDRPRLALFFDEAHLLFADAPKVLLEKIEQAVKLIRSKGVGLYFVTQNPADIPEAVLAQLGNRVQHALRAYTPRERKAVRAASEAFRPNPAFDTAEVIGSLEVGEALVSCLDRKAVPGMVERAWMLPPESRIGVLTPEERAEAMRSSALAGFYERVVDRESAYEILTKRVDENTRAQEEAAAEAAAERGRARAGTRRGGSVGEKGLAGEILGDFAKKTQQSVTRNIANQIGRGLVRGLLGGLFGGRK